MIHDDPHLRFARTITLADGRRLKIRAVGKGDAHYLRDGFAHLSEPSRYARFCGPKDRLSDAECRFLTDVDQRAHVAVGALDLGQPVPQGVAIARYIRQSSDPSTAELAITVVDSAQGQGIGGALFDILGRDAVNRGIDRFRATFLADNQPMARLVDQWGGRICHLQRALVEAIIPVRRALR